MAEPFPALIIAYSRPDGLQRLLQASYGSGIREIYVAIDGPKNESVARTQNDIFSVIRNFQRESNLELHVWIRDRNLGAAVSVITAIDWFFHNVRAGFIFEDDLVPSSDFFRFAYEGLLSYENDSDIWMISGSRMNPEISNKCTNDWSYYPMIWGWATWRAKWDVMRSAFNLADRKQSAKFFSPSFNFWRTGAIRAKSGMIDAWDLPLAYFQWTNSKFSVIPPVNLVTNIGFDSAATHTSGTSFPLNHPTADLPKSFHLQDMPDAKEARKYDRLLEKNLFGVKWHHAFLNVYRRPIDKLRKSHRNLGELQARIKEVDIPK